MMFSIWVGPPDMAWVRGVGLGGTLTPTGLNHDSICSYSYCFLEMLL